MRIYLLIILINLLSIAHSQDLEEGGLSLEEEVVLQGATLFKNNCTQCHQVHKDIVGPSLANVSQRRTIEWLVNFIKYPQKTIESGDLYAVELYNQYKQYMPNHDFFSDEEILSILSYIKSESLKGPPVDIAEANNATTTTESKKGIVENVLFLQVLSIVLLTLLIVLLALSVMLSSSLTKFLKTKKDLSEENKDYLKQSFSLAPLLKSKPFIGIISFAFISIILQTTIDSLFGVGVQQGYAPTQPIAFSHKLHAGYYEIDCNYCHTTVEKSKKCKYPICQYMYELP